MPPPRSHPSLAPPYSGAACSHEEATRLSFNEKVTQEATLEPKRLQDASELDALARSCVATLVEHPGTRAFHRDVEHCHRESISTPGVLVVSSTASVIGSRSTSVQLRAECQHGQSWQSCGRPHQEILSSRHQGMDVGEVRRSERVAEERTWSRSIGGGPIPRSGATASNIIFATLANAAAETQGSDDPAAALAAPRLLGFVGTNCAASHRCITALTWPGTFLEALRLPHSTAPSPSRLATKPMSPRASVLTPRCGPQA